MNNNDSQTPAISQPTSSGAAYSPLMAAVNRSSADVHRISIAADGASFDAREDKSLLAAMEAANQSVIEVGCRGGGCGRCRVRLLQGEYVSKPMSKAHIKPGDEEQGLVLACRVFARSDMQLIPEPPEIGSPAGTAGESGASSPE
tara:strand:+ start:563 stop:997 length:435 start_codon:yes stop_codon:yes gene_type:complete